MALTTASEIRATGGIDDDRAHELFRYASPAALDAEVNKALAWAVGWLKSRVSTDYYTGSATSDTDRDELFKGAEQDMALYRLLPRLKIRKVSGRHAPYQQETSDRWPALIDTELLDQVETAIKPFITEDIDDAAPYSIGVFAITTAVDPDDVDCVTTTNQAILDRANGTWCPT